MGTISIALTLILALGQDPNLRAHHPVQPSRTNLTYEATCGSMQLRIEGYGYRQPEGAEPVILLNRRRLRGVEAAALARDLSDPRAGYRLSTRCGRPGEAMQLFVYRGKDVEGRIEYHVGVTEFASSRIVAYRPLEAANADTFWFS